MQYFGMACSFEMVSMMILQVSISEISDITKGLGYEIPMWLIAFVFLFVLFLIWVAKYFYKKHAETVSWRKRKMKAIKNTDFCDYLPYRKKRLYIPAMYQSKTPSDYPDPIDATIAEARQNLLDKMMEVLNDQNGRDTLFCILAGAGMGKSSFMVCLYLHLVHAMDGKEHDVIIFSLTQSDIIEKINHISDKENTILLLDALDENVEAMKNYEPFWKKLLNVIKDFNRVVITCRTQFFSSFDDEPNYTEIVNYSSKKGTKAFIRYYVSPFTSSERVTYIKKKFHWWQIIKRKKALNVMKQNESLMSRPLLLSNIDYLIDSKTKFDFTFQIYDALIETWAKREALRQGLHGMDADKLVNQIPIVSKAAALELYKNLANNEACNMSREQLDDFEKLHPLNMAELRINSLFNRDVKGNWKFSHKSFFEYFLSELAFEDFNQVPDIDKFDMGMQFYKQRCFAEFEFYLNSNPMVWFVSEERLYKRFIIYSYPKGFNPMHLIVVLKEKSISCLTIMDGISQKVLTPLFMTELNFTNVDIVEIDSLCSKKLPNDFLKNSRLQMLVLYGTERLTISFKKATAKFGYKCYEDEKETVIYKSNAKALANPYIFAHYPYLDLHISPLFFVRREK